MKNQYLSMRIKALARDTSIWLGVIALVILAARLLAHLAMGTPQ